jgi:alanyl-tRNA synthetase
VVEGTLSVGDPIELVVDLERRRMIMRNHSATHLLQAALRTVLGEHVRQAGSLVTNGKLRFDFQHPRATQPEELTEVERLVNAEILRNDRRTTAIRTYDDAVRDGAIAFFGDKYGTDVRVVSFGDFSTELCGGTHVDSTGDIGLFRIVSETGIGSGLRRIEAVTGTAALDYTLGREKILKGLSSRLRVPVEQLPARVDALAAKGPAAKASPVFATPGRDSVRTTDSGRRYVVLNGSPDTVDDVNSVVNRMVNELDAAVVLAVLDQEKSLLRVGVGVPQKQTPQIEARQLLKDILATTGGRGGGSATFAQGGGVVTDGPSTLAGIDDVVRKGLT